MYLLDNWHKFVCVAVLLGGYPLATSLFLHEGQAAKTELAMAQLGDRGDAARAQLLRTQMIENNLVAAGWAAVVLLCGLLFLGDLRRMLKKLTSTAALLALTLLLVGGSAGCRKPFEPVKLEVIKSNEEAFLLPLLTDGKKQESSSNEEYLKAKLVYAKQVQLPQQWVPTGYETWGWNGAWQDAATLIKVDKSPVTREWTADKASGTSDKNEAVWVMTSDQVEFSTGWTITARISGRDDAVKFLHNYPNGSLDKVLDAEVRGKLQAEFGLAVTDLPMDKLRKDATPVISRTVKNVIEFFKERGVTITNLGITGGFVYKDKSIVDTMVKVFNAEQERSVAAAKTSAQEELNKSVILESQGKAEAILKTKKAEADGIRMVAEARNYEVEKAKQDLQAYLQLKQLELQRELLLKWDGAYPRYFMGTGGAGQGPNLLLQLPPLDAGKK